MLYRYNSDSGLFTVPADGEGFYYFSIRIATFSHTANDTFFDIQINGQTLCSAYGRVDPDEHGGYFSEATCSSVASVAAGI